MATIQPIVMEILGNNWSGEITLSKRDLVMDTSNTKMSNPDDRIEFILEKGHKGAVVLLVRNKDVFPGEIKKTLRGQITELTTNEVWNFCEENDGSDALNVVHMREVLPRNGESEKGKKFFGLVDKNGKKDDILGIACVLEGSDKSAHLHRLAVSPSSQGSGVGGRIIESLKEKYDVITLRPTPEGRVLGETENPAENLRRYYKKRGFISGGDYTWNKNWINLNDETTAREWREIDDKNSIVFDDVKRSGAEVVDLFLRRVWIDKKDELNSETRDALSWWAEVRKEIKTSEGNLRRLRDERLRQAGLI
jgi:GNAT superfamily N-acetyltransferase